MPPRAKKTKDTQDQNFTQGNILEATIERIVERHRRRTQWHKAEKTLTLQGKAVCRRICAGDKKAGSDLFEKVAKLSAEQVDAILIEGYDDPQIFTAIVETYPMIQARRIMNRHREMVENELEDLAHSLPIMEWISQIPGVGPGSLAAVIGNTGNLWNYATVQKLWKRMGMAVMPDGRRQRNIKGADEAAKAAGGYNAQRRSVVWNIGTSIMFSQTEQTEKDAETGEVIRVKRRAGEYRKIYDARRAYEEEKNERGDYAALAEKILKGSQFAKTTEAYKAYSQGKLPKGHLKSRAQRYMEKEFLKRLWVEWRRTMRDAMPAEPYKDPEPAVPPKLVKAQPVRFGAPL